MASTLMLPSFERSGPDTWWARRMASSVQPMALAAIGAASFGDSRRSFDP